MAHIPPSANGECLVVVLPSFVYSDSIEFLHGNDNHSVFLILRRGRVAGRRRSQGGRGEGGRSSRGGRGEGGRSSRELRIFCNAYMSDVSVVH